MWALAYMFVVSLPHPHGSSAGSSEWWRQFRQYIAVHPLKARGAAWQVSILCSRSTAAQTGDESNGRSTRECGTRQRNHFLPHSSPSSSLPRPAGKAAPGNQPRTLGTRTKPRTRRRTRMAAGVRRSTRPGPAAALRPIQASRPRRN